MIDFQDTIFAPASAAGGAVCIIRISGPKALELADSVIRFKNGAASSSNGYRIKFGSVMDGEILVDEVLVSIFRSPHSFTGEDSVEITCHGSSYIVSEIMRLLSEHGGRCAEPGEFTKRAFVGGKMDLCQAEAVADIVAAKGALAHRLAIKQLKGTYSQSLKELRDKLVELSALLELELDFSEEDVEFADRSKLDSLLESACSEVLRLKSSFKTGNAIKNGVPVAIIGAVNAGKSTLLNRLLEEDRAIVSDIPGTTRDTIEGVVDISGVQVRFIDTAGLRETSDKIEKIGIEKARDMVSRSEVVIGVLDAQADRKTLLSSAREIIDMVGTEKKLVLVRNKVDIFDQFNPEDYPVKDTMYHCFDLKYPAFGTYDMSPSDISDELDGFPLLDISAQTGEGISELCSQIVADYQYSSEATVVTSQRHYEALSSAYDHLGAVRSAIRSGLTPDLLSEDLRAAIYSMNSIFGDSITPDEILGTIFSKFCIGK